MCKGSHLEPMAALEEDKSIHCSVEEDKEEERERNQRLAKRETKAIGWLRGIVALVLIAVAIAVSILVYLYAKGNEKGKFEDAFEEYSSKVVDSFKSNAARRVAAIDGLSMAFTSHAMDTNAEWPMVTLPDYERRASRVMDLAEVVGIFQFPLVTVQNRETYETYALEHQDWLQEGVEIRQQEILQRLKDGETTMEDEAENLAFLDTLLGQEGNATEADTPSISSQLYWLDGGEVAVEEGPGPYFPIWQFAPALPLPNLVNYNAIRGASHTKELEALLETETVVTSRAFDFSDDSDPDIIGRKPLLNLILSRWKSGGQKYAHGPVSDLYYPIYDSFDESTRNLVAVFDALVYWQVYFVDILPSSAQGVVVVLENSCNQTFTYTINGEEAEYVGPGDLHESAYTDYQVSTGFGAFLGGSHLHNEDEHHCSYNVKVYPSSTLENSFSTNTPTLFVAILVCVFAFTSLVFIVYDRLVEKRQMIVLTTAILSSNVVDELFPAQVRKGLYAGDEEEGETHKKGNSDKATKFLELNDFSDDENEGESSSPNAQLYHNCTVIFADIAGFTEWSSGRDAKQVFKLLELLYKEFDKLAEKRKVFKVETIGDCYMAVTGCPKAQPDHALRMARFANDIHIKMVQMRPVLSKLGAETAKLAMRVGLNSGPVTAGVLRGQKARFQLFGDTVNTASRMESTGQPRKIQVSSSTAEALIQAGKQDWLAAREDMIEAKGKGKLQTYWLEMKGEGSVVTSEETESLPTLTTSSTGP